MLGEIAKCATCVAAQERPAQIYLSESDGSGVRIAISAHRLVSSVQRSDGPNRNVKHSCSSLARLPTGRCARRLRVDSGAPPTFWQLSQSTIARPVTFANSSNPASVNL